MTESFAGFLRRKVRESRGEEVSFQIRDYQLRAAAKCCSISARGRNALVDLPTGAGKTNVAFLTALRFRRALADRGCKILYIVPGRILIDQVVRAASWAAPEMSRVGISEELCSNVFRLRAAVAQSDVIVTTPGLFASLLRRWSLSWRELRPQVALVVVDEFDEFLLLEPRAVGHEVRFDSDFASLWGFINGVPILLMSGTAPGTVKGVVQSLTAEHFARFVQTVFQPTRVAIPTRTYLRHVPFANVTLVGCHDPFVRASERAIGYQISVAIRDFECETGIDLDTSYLLDRLVWIASGSIRSVRLKSGRLVGTTQELIRLCRRLLDLLNQYVFLYEDMFSGISPQETRVRVVENCVETGDWMNVYVLDDRRKGGEFHPSLQSKADALLKIARSRGKENGVVFTRFTRLSDALGSFLEDRGLRVWRVDARIKSEHDRYRLLKEFQRSKQGVLILTRGTGRRGLDIPRADYAVLYSPKDDEYVVWQELSRIRSTLHDKKPSFILYYRGTTEEERVSRLRADMLKAPHKYKFSA